jgi:putative membrane protein
MSRILTFACIAALASGGAVAQPASPPAAAPGNPATTPAGTPHTAPGTPAPDQLNDSDRLFSDALAAGGMAEVEAGKLASRVTGNAMVRQFGELMIQDHSKANKQLMEVAAAAKVALPGGPDTEHRAMQQQLEQLHGAAFDVAYVGGQIQGHARTIQLLEYEIGSGQNPRLIDFASETLPVVMEHLAMAQRLNAELTGAGVPETAEDARVQDGRASPASPRRSP